jgi:hypothetical protein
MDLPIGIDVKQCTIQSSIILMQISVSPNQGILQMKQVISRTLAMAAVLVVALTGCAGNAVKPQAFNREAHTNLKTITVLEMPKVEPSVLMMNHPGSNFGLIGGLIAAADMSSMEGKLQATAKQAGFEPIPYFKERLTAEMLRKGYTVQWPNPLVETEKTERAPFRKTYQSLQNADAQMDINMSFIGYVAAGAGKDAPYRPVVSLAARLVSADGKEYFYSDHFAYNNVFNIQDAVVIEPAPQYVYPKFTDLHNAGTTAVDGLKQALDSVAAELVKQL